jgi:hypothetical protein
MVSVFEGFLTREWWYPVGSEADGDVDKIPCNRKRSNIILFHNTVIGARVV